MLLQVVIMFGLTEDGQIFVEFKISFLASGLVSCWQREMLSDCWSKAHSIYYNFESQVGRNCQMTADSYDFVGVRANPYFLHEAKMAHHDD